MEITKYICPKCGITFFVESTSIPDVCPCCERHIDANSASTGTYEWED